MSCWMFN